MGWPHLRRHPRWAVNRQRVYLLWSLRVGLVPARVSCPALLAGRPTPVAGMEYPHDALTAGGIPLTPVVDSGWPERYGVGVGSRAADDADGCPRDPPPPDGQTPGWGAALYSAAGTRLGSRQTRLAAATACHSVAGLLPALSLGDLEAAGDSFVLDGRRDRERCHPPI